ncbi:LLM class F420-dependent oxidoreductase [Streptomyces coacervatus]|uniref:LLM class F420-dependent oxidoreductase n=1 Tax=Streptomyces coacervatus TaxID=647381 RepID=A0ABP7HSR4_9ACTN|nr:LLM class flavin-dependent oxidoreductase [Streptomyces coacervatus]MDF2270725.1 LLM class flavin-dependent oxidoreductase [Streptomyces coacervatus]
MTAYSVLMPFLPRRPEQTLPYAALVHWTHAERLWQGQALMVEPHQGFAYAAGAGFRVPVGLGVTLMPLRHPYEAALQARSLAMATGHPVVAGFGPGARTFQQSLLGKPYRSPLSLAREYVTAVRGLLDGAAVEVRGEHVTADQVSLPPFPAPKVEVGLGVLRPGMARLAGEVAEVAISWLTPASYLRDTVVPALDEGAEAAGRARPRLTAMVPLALARPDRTAAELALAGSSAHMKAPHYVDMLRRSGTGIFGADEKADAEALVSGGAFLSGAPDRLVEQLQAYEAAGVDEIVLNVTGVCNSYGPQAAMEELKTLLALLA